jgi:LAGLIDADG DNA endonuclease family protein
MKLKLNYLTEQRIDPKFYLSFITDNWIVAFYQAEGGVYGNNKDNLIFTISQHISDWYLLEAIRLYLGEGNIIFKNKDGKLYAQFIITNNKTLLEVIIPLLDNNICSIKKLNQYNDWKFKYFYLPPTVQKSIITPEWLCGFVDGDGSFSIIIRVALDYVCGFQVFSIFDIAQIDTERPLLN